MTAPIVLMTDFGTRDSYVGVMKGVMAGIAPTISVIDLTDGFLELAIRNGNAAQTWNIGLGVEVVMMSAN